MYTHMLFGKLTIRPSMHSFIHLFNEWGEWLDNSINKYFDINIINLKWLCHGKIRHLISGNLIIINGIGMGIATFKLYYYNVFGCLMCVSYSCGPATTATKSIPQNCARSKYKWRIKEKSEPLFYLSFIRYCYVFFTRLLLLLLFFRTTAHTVRPSIYVFVYFIIFICMQYVCMYVFYSKKKTR